MFVYLYAIGICHWSDYLKQIMARYSDDYWLHALVHLELDWDGGNVAYDNFKTLSEVHRFEILPNFYSVLIYVVLLVIC